MTKIDATVEKQDARLDDVGIDADVGFLLAKAGSIASRHARNALEPLGMRVRTYSLLSITCDFPPANQRELAVAISLDPSQLVPLIDELETQGLVERTPDPNDRRTKLVVPTKLGRERRAEIEKVVRGTDITFASGFTEAEHQQLVAFLQRLVAAQD
ncbi:MarR family transcriptional regulator [Gulosibacter macacae]|uniref:MarR family transcriptional regulator n=1 Tax=Gulosibacter macacae TaxID=2488791 RepID=A0A3P3W6K4_9MICO|nr:MarR family transcriptional regulator [Gulosibacter macacae]RRJ88283.1 MarR family transcriptional regulator [Gulosibacter macacae]